MKNKFKLVLLVLQLELCWKFIKAWRKKTDKYFEKGGHFTSNRSKKLYKHLQKHSDNAMILTQRLNKMTSIGTPPMEAAEVK